MKINKTTKCGIFPNRDVHIKGQYFNNKFKLKLLHIFKKFIACYIAYYILVGQNKLCN